MARRIPSANGVRENGEAPPPSTLAAQIVQNGTRPAATQKNGQAPTFSELLHEILHNQAAAIETDIATNVKLINVVAEAGLVPLANNDPFLQLDVLIPLAIDSIAVIKATVKRQPGVLFTPVTQDGQQPLLPLLARLFAICGRSRCDSLPISSLLDSILQALDTSLDLWQNAQTMRQMIQDCALEAITSLEATISPRSDYSIKLPPARSIAALWPQSKNAIALPHGFQTTIVDRTQSFMLVLELSKLSKLSRAWRNDVQLALQRLAPMLRPQLESSKQWNFTSQYLLDLPDGIVFLVYITRTILQNVPSVDIQRRIARGLIVMLRRDGVLVHDNLLSLLSSLAATGTFDALHEDLRIAVTTTICRLSTRESWPERVSALHDALREDNIMTDSEFQASFLELSVRQISHSHPPKRKRRRLDPDQPDYPSTSLIQRTTRLLTGIEADNLNALSEAAPNVYRSLEEDERCKAWQLLIELASLHPQTTSKTVTTLVESLESHESKRARVLAMLAIRKCLEKTTDATYLDLSRSAFGRSSLQGLQNSVREIRIASGQCLECFLREDLPPDLRDANRKAGLEHLRGLSRREVASQQETLVSTWRQVALICGEKELNLALLALVEYLGHPNTFICGLAYIELECLADAKSLSLEELLKPFWDTIAFSVLKDLHSRPQKAQQLCDLLQVDINRLLVDTQRESIPSLVLAKKKSVLERIARACGHDTSVQDLLLKHRTNLMPTLALLLTQPSADVEANAMACLVDVAPSLSGTDIVSLVKLDATLLACNMLQYVGDQDDSRKSRAYQTFEAFACLATRHADKPKTKSIRMVAIDDLFNIHILGIMAHFSEIIENTNGLRTRRERIRSVKAIGEMVNIAKNQVYVALIQIRATLQSAMGQDGLCEASFSAWMNLLPVLQGEHIATIVNQTFALMIRHWGTLSPELQQICHDRIGNLIKDHNKVLRENLLTVPSLKDIPLLSKYSTEFERYTEGESVENHCKAFTSRLGDESGTVVLQALEELPAFLNKHAEFIHDSATTEQPGPALSQLLRALLDAIAKYSSDSDRAADLCGQALGIIGCVDPNRIEAPRSKRRILTVSNFEKADEVIDWVIVLLEDVLVKAFKSTTNARLQGFLAFVMQELLLFCNFTDGVILRPRSSQAPTVYQKWMKLSEHVRITLTPFLTSKYVLGTHVTRNAPNRVYPSFTPETGYDSWLRSLVFDLMFKAKGDNAGMVFPLLTRIIRGHDLAIPSFILPYIMLNVVLGGTVAEVQGLSDELLAVLGSQPTGVAQEENIKLCSESVFSVLDYMSTWLREKKKILGETRAAAFRTGHSPSDFDEAKDAGQIDTVERFLASIPAEMIATRAIVCGSYARALFNWEQYIRRTRPLIASARPPESSSDDETLYMKLQQIYGEIDEPDGLEGISAHLRFLSDEQQAIQHAKAGRWSAAQAWYELQLSDSPHNVDLEEHLLACFRETGRYEVLLRYADSFITTQGRGIEGQLEAQKLLPSILQAQWMTNDLEGIKTSLNRMNPLSQSDFDVGIANLLVAVMEGDNRTFSKKIKDLRTFVTQSMTTARTSSIQASHDDLRKLHVLHEVEALVRGDFSASELVGPTLDKRLAVIGSYMSDKKYVIGVRRAVMQSLESFGEREMGSSWLIEAKLARQSGNTEHAYNAALKAYECGNKGAKIEEARLLWRDGHQRHAIHALESAIASGMFETTGAVADTNSRLNESSITTRSTSTTVSNEFAEQQNLASAKVHLLLAKWLDASGQVQVKDLTEKYQAAAGSYKKWEKGHYYLGLHYQKLLDAERALPKEKQSSRFQSGEYIKLIIDNLARSIPWGNKYWHQSIPKMLTLWLDLGLNTLNKARNEDQAVFDRRVIALRESTRHLSKYFLRVSPFVFYSALPQMISRITHPNPEVWKVLSNIITQLVSTYPSQALWSLFPVIKATDRTRLERGVEIFNRLKNPKTKTKGEGSNVELGEMIIRGQKLSDGLLRVCDTPIENKDTEVRLGEDLGFNHRLAPSQLVVPIETTLTTSLPSGADHSTIRRHKAFVQDKITIQSFNNDVLVLNSLQRPRKLTVRGSDGKQYGLLCKPKDDLRKDRRLMEFNGIINRVLKRDAESSKRQLYVKTYAVTPLSEESGIIEWVEGIKPMRDILLTLYARRGVRPNYSELKGILEQACAGPEHAHIFVDKVLSGFPPVLHEWFTEIYPEPDAWFAARLRYARSAAVMSMAGHVLGLGDRHGENILLEESTGGVFHVDFNCLFDKGLTFDKPELTPFRLTHNMVDAMGPYGYEGPFRKSCELTLGLLRQSKDTLMTILETFLYDPTTDFIGQNKKKRATSAAAQHVPETPQEILDSVEGKLRGLLRGEKVPLGVEGYVDALIREATGPFYLASMYIGWCAFL